MVEQNGKSDTDSLLVHKATPEYLQDLLKDKKQLQNFPNIFLHLEVILEKEITRVRQKLFHLHESFKKTDHELPEPSGTIVTLQEKVFVPVKENPNYNFVGRLLGPRGLTAKQLEQDLECKIMVRGRGSLRDKKKEDMNRGKPNWEHLDEDLHVLVSVEDYENRAPAKLRRATDTIRTFLEQGVRTPENEDRLKQLQLMELAVLNDKDRQQAQVQQLHFHQQQQLMLQQQQQQQHHPLLSSQVAMAAAATQLLNRQATSGLSPYLPLLAPLTAGEAAVASSSSAIALDPLHYATPAIDLTGLTGIPMTQQARTSASTLLGGQDQLSAAIAAALLNGTGQTATQQQKQFGVSFAQHSLVESVQALESYANSTSTAESSAANESLKIRVTSSTSSQHRAHPYLR